jgi:hypothetical protein
MPYHPDPQITAVWKPSQITLSLGAEGSMQQVTRSIDSYIYEDEELDLSGVITGQMVGGLKVSLSNIIVAADVAATNEYGSFGNSYRVSSVGNQSLAMTVASGSTLKFHVTVSNSKQGYTAEAEQVDDIKDISGRISNREDGFVLTVPANTSGQDQTYRITVSSKENENIAVVVTVTVKSEAVSEPSDKPAQEPTDEPVDEPTEKPTEPAVDPTEPTVKPTEPTEEP